MLSVNAILNFLGKAKTSIHGLREDYTAMLEHPTLRPITGAFHARARGSLPGLGDLKETKMFLPHPLVKREVLLGAFATER